MFSLLISSPIEMVFDVMNVNNERIIQIQVIYCHSKAAQEAYSTNNKTFGIMHDKDIRM